MKGLEPVSSGSAEAPDMRSIISCMLSATAKRSNICQVLLPPGFVKKSEFRDEYRDSWL